MRIWAFPSFYPFDFPGLKWNGIFAHRQYKGLVENGVQLQVIQPVEWHPGWPLCLLDRNWKKLAKVPYPLTRVYDGITVHHPRVSNMKPGRIFQKPYAERFVDAVSFFFKSNNIALNSSTDIFYSQWLPNSVHVQLAARKLGVRSAVLAIGDDVIVWPRENKSNLEAFKKVWTEADLRISVAAYLAKEGNELIGQDLPYDVVRRGVEYQNFKPVSAEKKAELRVQLQLPANKLIILTVGTSIVRKGWLDLFDALQQMRSTVPDFLLVGIHSGKPDIDLRIEAEKRGLTDQFINLGEVEPKLINQYYNAADIFCLPSHWEGIANTVVEAMSCGLAVVTTNVSGHPELIENDYNGILVPPKDPVTLYQKLSLVISDTQLRESLGKGGRKFIVEKWGNFADNSKLLYAKLSQQ